MYLLPWTITLLVVIAHAQCGTLRQYGPDWLIPKPDPHVDSKRITAKSVFIAPSLQAQQVRCATGFREDGGGRCVKVVHVNQAAQLDFLLQRLNAMYGAPVTSHSEKQPLQVAVAIPVELGDGNDTSIPVKGDEIYSEAILPEGEVSVDLLASTINQPDSTEEIATENSTKEHQNEDLLQGINEESVLPDFGNESEDNQTNLMMKPNKEWFQVDEEPIVTLTSIDSDDEEEEDLVGSATANYENATNSPVELQDTLSSIHSIVPGFMANVTKNASNVIKKETHLGNGSDPLSSESSSNYAFTDKYPIEAVNATGVQTVHNVHNNTEQGHHTSNHSSDMFQSNFTANGEKTDSSEDESINEVHINATSSKLNDTKTSGESTTSVSPTTEASTTQMPTRQPMVTNFTAQETTTRESTSQIFTSAMPAFATNEGSGEAIEQNTNKASMQEHSGEKVESEKQGANEDDYDYPVRDVDVEPQLPDEYYTDIPASGNGNAALEGEEHQPEVVHEGSADGGLVLSVNDSVKMNSSSVSAVDGDDESYSVETDLEGNDVGVNKTLSLNSTESIEKTDLDNGIISVPSSNVTSFGELASVNESTETGDKTSSEGSSNVSGQSVVKDETSEVLKADSTVQNLEVQPYEFSEIVHNGPQQIQHQSVITPQHTVHVVYPQPIIQVLSVKKDPPPSHPINLANQNEPIIGHKENIKPPLVQLHNLNPIPNPLQNHNFNPLPQMPLIEKAPEIPPKYDVHPYRPLAPQSEMPRPYLHPHHRPYPQHYPNPSGAGGFVRFPSADEVNTVRFPQEDARNNDKYSRWGNWRGEQHHYWPGAQDSQYPQGTNQRNYWVDNRPNRRRPQPQFYY